MSNDDANEARINALLPHSARHSLDRKVAWINLHVGAQRFAKVNVGAAQGGRHPASTSSGDIHLVRLRSVVVKYLFPGRVWVVVGGLGGGAASRQGGPPGVRATVGPRRGGNNVECGVRAPSGHHGAGRGRGPLSSPTSAPPHRMLLHIPHIVTMVTEGG